MFKRRFASAISATLLVFTIVVSSSTPVGATATYEQDVQRRVLSTLIECLGDKHLDTDDDMDNFSDFFHDGHYTGEHIVVGFDRDSNNGVQSCKTVLANAIKILEPSANTETEQNKFFLKKLTGNEQLTSSVDNETVKPKRDAWVRELQNRVNALGSPAKKLTSTRLSRLVNICYDIKTSSTAALDKDKDFQADIGGKTHYFVFRDNLDDDDMPWLREKDGSGFQTNRIYLGDIPLDFSSGGVDDFDNWNNDFYPFGRDLEYLNNTRSFIDGYTADDSVLGCKFLFDNKSFVLDNIALVNENTDTIVYGDDADGDGVISEDEREANQSGGGLSASANAQDNATCESTGASLSWLFCPLVNGLADASDFVFDKMIRPLLQQPGVDVSDTDSPVYKVWSAFKFLANVVLIISVLVIVFGQSIGGGMIDAYTAKKVMPRLLVAAILVNLSIYIVSLLVDVTNIVALGISDLMYAPLEGAGEFRLKMSGGASGLGLAALIGGTFVAAAAITSSSIALGPIIAFLGLFVLLPALLAFLGVLVTLIIRRGLIIFLIIVSPIAFALYCLPSTEQYFKKWWGLLVKTLLVYPIVMVIFAVADIMSVTIGWGSQTSGATSVVGNLVSIVLLVLPLFLIPFAFKLAGGAIGQLYGSLSGWNKRGLEAFKGDERNPHSIRNKTKRNFLENATRGQARFAHQGRSLGATRRQRVVGGIVDRFGNVDQRLSTFNKDAAERREMLSATGDDSLIYAGAGWEEGGKYFDSKGREISAQTYSRGKSLYGRSSHDIGQGLAYTLGKVQTDDDLHNFRTAYSRAAVENNWNDDEAMNVWASATYPHKSSFASEWYSSPEVVADSSGRTAGVRFKDVDGDPKSYAKMAGDLHKGRQSFELGRVRDVDWRAMGEHQRTVQEAFDNGGIFKSGSRAGTAVTDLDKRNFAQTSEIIDAMVHQGMIQQDTEGNVSVSGASAAAQPVIEAIYRNRRYETEASTTPAGDRSTSLRDIVPIVKSSSTDPVTGAVRVNSVKGAPIATIDVTGPDDRSTIPRRVV